VLIAVYFLMTVCVTKANKLTQTSCVKRQHDRIIVLSVIRPGIRPATSRGCGVSKEDIVLNQSTCSLYAQVKKRCQLLEQNESQKLHWTRHHGTAFQTVYTVYNRTVHFVAKFLEAIKLQKFNTILTKASCCNLVPVWQQTCFLHEQMRI
jgi:hypothetical protein